MRSAAEEKNLGEYVSLAVTLAKYAVFMFGLGFVTIKFTWWGLCATATLWMGAPLVGSFTREEVAAEMLPRFEEILLFYPQKGIPMTFQIFDSHIGGYLGAGIAAIVVIIGVFPFSIGLWLGVTKWPELLLLRLVV